jgi:hypothetical protein
MLLHLPQHVGESVCVAFEACIHALEGAQAPHDHVGCIAFYLKKNDFGGVLINQSALVGGQCRDPSRDQLGLVVSYFFFYHIFPPSCSCTLPNMVGRAYVLLLKLAFMPQRLPKPPMIRWG